jgi:hypothetical protein
MLVGLAGLLLSLGLLNALFYIQQPGMVFFPYRTLEATPSDWGFEYEDVYFAAEDGERLHGWFIPSPGSRRVLLFFHGNAGNISHRGESIAIFHRLGLDVFIFDYRGYGRSEGAPSEEGLYADASAAWRYLTQTRGVPPQDIVAFGRSLGAAVAAELASREMPGALILESSFTSSRLIVLRYEFDTRARVARVSCPVLVLHSPEDEMIPFRLGEEVYRAANPPKAFVRMRGDHNSGFLRSQPEYQQSLGRFLSSGTQHGPR